MAQPSCNFNDKKDPKTCEIFALRCQGREGEHHSIVSNLSNSVKSVPSSRWDASFGAPPHRSKPASCPELSLDSEKSVRCCNKAGKGLV